MDFLETELVAAQRVVRCLRAPVVPANVRSLESCAFEPKHGRWGPSHLALPERQSFVVTAFAVFMLRRARYYVCASLLVLTAA